MIRDFTKLRGLDTATSNLAAQGEALAFEVLRNCVMRTAGVLESRRGFERGSQSFPGGVGNPDSLMEWASGSDSTVYAHTSTNKLVATSTGASHTTLTGTFVPPSSTQRMRGAAHQRRFYITSSAGLYRSLTPGADDLRLAGIEPPSVDWAVSRAASATGGFLPNDSAAGYRAWVVLVDSNGLEIVGEVSDLVVIQNPALANVNAGGLVRTGGALVTVTCTAAHGFKVGDAPTLAPGEANFPAGAKAVSSVPSATTFTYSEAGANVASAGASTFAYGASQGSLRVMLPTIISTSHILRVARTRSVTPATATPQPDTFLVYETQPTATDVSNGYVDVLDNTPDSLLGPICYASPGAEGLQRNNAVPPRVNDVCVFSDCLVGANTLERHRFEVQLLATGGSSGIVAGDTFVIVRGATTITLTFGSSYGSTAPTVYSGGTVTNDIERTARALVSAINSNALAPTASIRARYISSADDAPGRIAIEATDYATTSFTVTCSARPLAWQPTLGTTPSNRVSTQASHPNHVVFSKPGLPDAFPAIQYVPVGSADDAILRVVPLNDSAIVIKQRSAWTLTGAWPFFSAKLLDPEIRCEAADTAAALGNQVHVLTSQGVAVVSESGVGLIGLPVLRDTTEYYRSGAPTLSYGLAVPNEHTYWLYIDNPSGGVGWLYAWNQMLKTWTGPLMPDPNGTPTWNHAIALSRSPSSAAKVVVADSASAQLRWEVKLYVYVDYIDDRQSLPGDTNVTANDGAGTLTCTTTNILVGDSLSDPDTGKVVTVTAVGASTVTVSPAPTAAEFTTGNAHIYRGIDCMLVSQPIRVPATAEKALREVRIHWRRLRLAYADVGAATNYVTAFAVDTPLSHSNTTTPTFTRAALLGAVVDINAATSGPKSDPCTVSAEVVRGDAHRLVIRIRGAFNDWAIEGISLVYGDGSTERTRRV